MMLQPDYDQGYVVAFYQTTRAVIDRIFKLVVCVGLASFLFGLTASSSYAGPAPKCKTKFSNQTAGRPKVRCKCPKGYKLRKSSKTCVKA